MNNFGLGMLNKIRSYTLKGHSVEVFEEYVEDTTEVKQLVVFIDKYFNKGCSEKQFINKFILEVFKHYDVPIKKGGLI